MELDARERARDGVDAGGARAVATSGEQRLLVEPDEVAALRDRGAVERRCDGDTGALEVVHDRTRLSAPTFLTRAKHDAAVLGYEAGIERVHRVRIVVERVGHEDVGARLLEDRAESLVLARDREIGRAHV